MEQLIKELLQRIDALLHPLISIHDALLGLGLLQFVLCHRVLVLSFLTVQNYAENSLQIGPKSSTIGTFLLFCGANALFTPNRFAHLRTRFVRLAMATISRYFEIGMFHFSPVCSYLCNTETNPYTHDREGEDAAARAVRREL